MDDISQLHKVPNQQWISDGAIFKFWGDNVDKQRYIRDLRSDYQGEMLHIFRIIVGQSRTPAPELPLTGQLSQLAGTPSQYFLPSNLDVAAVKDNLVVLLSVSVHRSHSPRCS